MPLPFEPLQFPFRFGLAEGIDPYQAPAGTLTVADNVEWLKSGLLQKRLGANAMGTDVLGGSSLSAGRRLFVRGSELLMTDGTYIYSWSSVSSQWILMDRIPDAGLTWRTTLDSHDGVACSDIVYANGRIVQAWIVGDPFQTTSLTRMLWVQIFDATTGATTLVSTPLSSQAHGVRVLYDGTQCFVLYSTLGTNILAKRINMSTFAVAAVGFLVTDKVSTAGWDALIVGSDIVVAWESTPNGNLELERFTYNSGTNTYASAATGGITSAWGVADDFRSIAIDGIAGERLYVVYHSTNLGETFIATANISTMAEITAPVSLESGIESYNVTVKRIDASNVVAGWSAQTTSPDRGRATTMKLSSVLAADTTSRRGSWGTQFASRMFAIGSRFFAMLSDAPVVYSSAFSGVDTSLVEIETSSKGATDYVPHRYLGRLDVLVGGTSAKGFIPSGVSVSSTVAHVAVPFLSAVPQLATFNWQCGLRLATVTIGSSLPNDMWRSVEYGGELYMEGSLLSVYDGRTVFDYGFPRALVIGSIQGSSPTAGSIAAGNYLYGFTREYRSAVGVLHRSPVVTTTGNAPGANATITVVIASCGLTTKIDVGTGTDFPAIPIVIASHRSTVGQSNYHRLAWEPLYNTIRYDVETASHTLTDTVADADISGAAALGVTLASRPLIYSTGDDGGILQDEQPPSGITLALHRDRLWRVAGDRRTIWFSKTFQDDIGVAPGFSTSFRIVFEKDLVALGVLEDKLIPMAEDGLWYIQGEGPAPDGSNSDFSKATPIQTDVGCSQPRSPVSTPRGLMFANADGIYLLTRGLDVVFIGRPIQETFNDYPIVTSATLISRRNQVRFTCTNEAGDEGIVFVYDYEEEQWATRTYSAAFVSSCLWNDRWVALTASGVVMLENLETDAAAYLDDGEWITSTIETTWISRSGPNTYQRVRRAAVLAKQITDADHTVEIAVNGDDTFVETRLWQSDESFSGRVGIHVKNQKSHAIKMRVSDAAPTGVGATVGNGQGFLWSMLALELAQKKGLEKRAEGAKK